MKNNFKNNQELINWVISLRRHFHQHPEISFKEFNTQKKIIEVLNSLGIETKNIATTGVIGLIRGAKEGAENGMTIAIRSDIDALKIQEEKTELNQQYISCNSEYMHACGHDGHIAMVLGTAKVLQENKHELKGNVKLIFQPAEEIPPGGASEVIREGGLDNVNSILGAHLFTNIPSGEIRLKQGVLMAAHSMYNIKIFGKSGHHFNPDVNIDPILIASEFIASIQSNLKNNIPPNVNFVFGTGTINGGKQFNQTPENVTITGSYRMLGKEIHLVERVMRQVLDGLMKIHSKEGSDLPNYLLDVTYGYPQLDNHQKFTQRATQIIKDKFPIVIENTDSVFASEDFARYLEKIPGTYIFIGAGNSEKGIVYGNHSNKFDIDEEVLITGVEIFSTLAIDFLNCPDAYL